MQAWKKQGPGIHPSQSCALTSGPINETFLTLS